jgi:hypothetical protein
VAEIKDKELNPNSESDLENIENRQIIDIEAYWNILASFKRGTR